MSITKHHMWCNRFNEVIEGTCSMCDRLNLQYPPLGHLDYTEQILHYFPDVEVIPNSTPQKGPKGSQRG